MRTVFSLVLLAGLILAVGCVSQKEYDKCVSDKELYLAELKKARAEQLEQVKILAEAGYQLEQKVRGLQEKLKSVQNVLTQAQQTLKTTQAGHEKTLQALHTCGLRIKELQEQLDQANKNLAKSQQTQRTLESANADLTRQIKDLESDQSSQPSMVE